MSTCWSLAEGICFFLARRGAGRSKGYKTSMVGFCVAQAKMLDTVSGVYTCNTVKL